MNSPVFQFDKLDVHHPEFLAQIKQASAETKRAVIRDAVEEGLEDIAAGRCVEGTPEQLMARMDEHFGMTRSVAS